MSDLDPSPSASPEGLDAREIAQRLAVLPERDMRAARLCEIVIAAEAGEAAWLLDALATAGRAGGPPFDLCLLAAVDLASSERLPYDRRRAIFEAADAQGLQSCKELLLTSEDLVDDDVRKPRALIPGTRPLTLGERKSLARSWRRDVIERMVADPAPDVVALLLANPHVTETDILRIATARRSSGAVLELVLRSRRWGARTRVRRALVNNPRLPQSTALRLVGLLNRAELMGMANDNRLPPMLLDAIRRRLRLHS